MPRLFLFFFPLLLLSCVPTGGSSLLTSWPVQQYGLDCRMMPMEPVCLTMASGGRGFKYRDEFVACSQSLKNFIDANEYYFACVNRDIKGIFDKLLDEARISYNCLSKNYKNSRNDLYQGCRLVSIPDFPQRYQADGLEHSFGIPYCLREKGSEQSPLFKERFLSKCKEETDIFLGGAVGLSLRANSAQQQYEKFIKSLQEKTNDNAENAVRKFNCIARGNDFCL